MSMWPSPQRVVHDAVQGTDISYHPHISPACLAQSMVHCGSKGLWEHAWHARIDPTQAPIHARRLCGSFSMVDMLLDMVLA